VAVWAGIALGDAQASISYQYVTDQTNYTAASGTSVQISIFLQETVTGTSSSLIAQEGGMFGIGALVTKTSGSATFDTSVNGGFIQFDAAWNGGNKSNAPATQNGTNVGGFANVGNNPTGVIGTAVANQAGKFLVKLGTLNIVASATQSNYTVGANTFNGGNTLTNTSGFDLDVSSSTVPVYTGAVASTFTINAAAVPEPTSIALAGFLVSGIGLGAWRRRRAAQAVAVA
jgi:hypothetical protein